MKKSEILKVLNNSKEKDQKIVLTTKNHIYYAKVDEIKNNCFYIKENENRTLILFENIKNIK